jgi:2-polyprenyl-3-methyl-5-hydroxy-6-metoxy-1,4-benzoquinol methylase
MEIENNYICCKNYGYKKIFSSNEYEWRICEKCDLIYLLSLSERLDKIKEVQFDEFEEALKSAKFEFLSILKILKKYSNLSHLTFFDFGCGEGSYLKIAEEHFKKVQGMEPNTFLKNRTKKKGLEIIDDNFLDNKGFHYDVIFTRNTFEYVTGFSATLNKLMNKLNDNGYFVWRDKFYDYYPKNYSDIDFSDGFNSLPTKNSIKYHLSINQIEILESRFYFDKSFLIIGQKKKNLKNTYKKKLNINKIFYNNYVVCNVIFYVTEKIQTIYLLTRKLKYFFLKN